jgi:hypothetical protein
MLQDKLRGVITSTPYGKTMKTFLRVRREEHNAVEMSGYCQIISMGLCALKKANKPIPDLSRASPQTRKLILEILAPVKEVLINNGPLPVSEGRDDMSIFATEVERQEIIQSKSIQDLRTT